MSHLADPSSNSPRHLAGLASDYAESKTPIDLVGSSNETTEQADELSTLRDFNAKLLERISEIRRRNFELAKADELLREKDLELAQTRDQENKLRIKLSKLTDESWAKDLEIRSLKEAKSNDSGELSRLQSENAILQNTVTELHNRISLSEKLVAAKEAEVRFIVEERAKFVQDLTESHSNEVSQMRTFNHALGEEAQKLSQEALALREQLVGKEAQLRKAELEKNADMQTFGQVEAELNQKISELEAVRDEQGLQISQGSSLVISLEKALAQTQSELHQSRLQAEQQRRERDQAVESLRYQFQEKCRVMETDHNEVRCDLETRLQSFECKLKEQIADNERLESIREEQAHEISGLKTSLSDQFETLKIKSVELKTVRDENLASLAQARRREEESLHALDQKIESLRRQNEKDQSDARRTESELKARIKELESELSDKSRHLIDASHMALQLKKDLEITKTEAQHAADAAAQTLWETNERHQALTEQLRKRESELSLELATQRTERQTSETRLGESQGKIAELRAQLEHQRNESRIELRNLRDEAEKAFIEMQATLRNKLQSEFMTKFEAVLKENARMQALLDIKDNSAELERKELQKRQVHLNLLEQQLKSSASVLQNDRSKIVTLSKQLANELQQTRPQAGAYTSRQSEERAHALLSIIKNLNSGV